MCKENIYYFDHLFLAITRIMLEYKQRPNIFTNSSLLGTTLIMVIGSPTMKHWLHHSFAIISLSLIGHFFMLVENIHSRGIEPLTHIECGSQSEFFSGFFFILLLLFFP